MRIIGGRFRSKKFNAPPGNATRPTGDRAKVALFNMLQSQLTDAQVLDGFAGSGALSFEAVSRGSAMAVLFETADSAVVRIRENAVKLGMADQIDVWHGDFITGAAGLKGTYFNIIFLDPPYASGLLEKAIEVSEGLLSQGGVIVAEHAVAQEMPIAIGLLTKTETRNYGAAAFSFYKRQGS